MLNDELKSISVHHSSFLFPSLIKRGFEVLFKLLRIVRPESFEIIFRHRSVCVLDRELPGGGLIATAAIVSPRRAPKVLVVGGRCSPVERRAALLAGAAGSLPTDADAAAVAAAVSALVRREHR